MKFLFHSATNHALAFHYWNIYLENNHVLCEELHNRHEIVRIPLSEIGLNDEITNFMDALLNNKEIIIDNLQSKLNLESDNR